MTTRDHYEVLGVPRDATATAIRDAYRARIKRLHPDVGNVRDPNEAAAVNAAWDVLGDASRRARYDLSLVAAPPAAARAPSEPEVVYPPARFPWRFVLTVATLGALGMFMLHAFSNPTEPQGPDGLLGSGSCVVIDSALAAVEVECDGSHEWVVTQLVAFDRRCPDGTVGYRDRQGMGIACLVEP